MQVFAQSFFVLIAIFSLQQTFADKEILGIIEKAKDLTAEEYNVLHPLFVEFQTQYDILSLETKKELHNNNNNYNINNNDTVDEVYQIFDEIFHDIEQQLNTNFQPKILNIDTSLPTVDEILDPHFVPRSFSSPDELDAYLDMREILQELLDSTQQYIDDIVKQTYDNERPDISIDKIKILRYIYEGLQILFKVKTKGSRTAYCIYSHIPQFNSSLQDIYNGVDCYKYTLGVVATLENRTVELVNEIKANFLDIVRRLKYIANKKTTIGKILEFMKHFFRISNDIFHSYLAAQKELRDLKELLPQAIQNSTECGTNFLKTIPKMVETAKNLTACLLYVEPTTETYDFLKPENERI